jgi:hypothetical protein
MDKLREDVEKAKSAISENNKRLSDLQNEVRAQNAAYAQTISKCELMIKCLAMSGQDAQFADELSAVLVKK